MTTDPFRLDGRRALVTGGGTGIGLGITTALVGAGATVAIVGRRPAPLEAAAEAIGSRVLPFAADVTDLPAVPALLDRVASMIGTIDLLVNNAGIQGRSPALEQDDATTAQVLSTHIGASMALSREFAIRLVAASSPGTIVNIGSTSARIGLPNSPAYAAAKAGLTGLTRAHAAEWGPHKIRVNTVTPGWVLTDMTDVAFKADPQRRHKVLARTPLGGLGSVADIGLAVVYLSSDASAFVTGIDLPIDGGAAIGF